MELINSWSITLWCVRVSMFIHIFSRPMGWGGRVVNLVSEGLSSDTGIQCVLYETLFTGWKLLGGWFQLSKKNLLVEVWSRDACLGSFWNCSNEGQVTIHLRTWLRGFSILKWLTWFLNLEFLFTFVSIINVYWMYMLKGWHSWLLKSVLKLDKAMLSKCKYTLHCNL